MDGEKEVDDMPKRKTTSGTQIVLAIVMFMVMISGFAMVFAIDYYYNGSAESEILYSTDSSYESLNWIVEDSSFTQEYYLRNAFTIRDYAWTPPQLIQYNKTAVYQGNDTWVMSANATSSDIDASQLQFTIDLPNLNKWVIETIDVNLNVDTTDDDVRFNYAMLFCNNKFFTDVGVPPQERFELIYNNQHSTFATSFPDGWYNQSINVPLASSLDMYDLAQEKTDYGLLLNVLDYSLDGNEAWTVTYNIEITGRKISGWSIADSLTWALGGSAFIGFVTAVYMMDNFDIGGTFRDLPRMKRSNPKRKKKSGRRKK